MPQTFYVAQDEEVLSLVGRLRSSALLENVFVVPNRALILQSPVNLRILRREAEKLGKAVTIVTQDELGRLLVEKAGIPTKLYSDEIPRDATPASPSVIDHSLVQTAIGSSEFFTPSDQKLQQPPQENQRNQGKEPSELPRAGADSGDFLPDGVKSAPLPLTKNPSGRSGFGRRAEDMLQKNTNRNAVHEPAAPALAYPSVAEQLQARKEAVASPSAESRLAHVFQKKEPATLRPANRASFNKKQKPIVTKIEGKGHFWFLSFALASIAGVIGAAIFFFLPKAEIIVMPQSSSQSLEMEFDGKKDGASEGERNIPMRLFESEEEVTVSLETSGVSSDTSAKSRGTVIISNAFGPDPQPLVATTRLETKDGKIFRLIKGVSVPGVSEVNGKKQPGTIEAEVIADAPGSAYDIGPDSFVIPGFKGTPKYESITALSKTAMTGGSVEKSSDIKTVSSGDIDRAKEESQKIFRSKIEESIKASLAEGESFLPQSMEITQIGEPVRPEIGVVATSFDYKVRMKARAFIFSESLLKEKAAELLKRKAELGDMYQLKDISLEYGDASVDFTTSIMYIKTRATALFVANIDTDTLRDEFLGKKPDGIKQVLEKHPEVKKIEILLKPKLFIVSVPKDASRVKVRVEEP